MQDCNRLSIRPEWDLSHYRWGMVSDTQLLFTKGVLKRVI